MSFGKASVIRPSVNGKVKYARIPIIRKSAILDLAREYAERVVASRLETPMYKKQRESDIKPCKKLHDNATFYIFAL